MVDLDGLMSEIDREINGTKWQNSSYTQSNGDIFCLRLISDDGYIYKWFFYTKDINNIKEVIDMLPKKQDKYVITNENNFVVLEIQDIGDFHSVYVSEGCVFVTRLDKVLFCGDSSKYTVSIK
jgi:hypothetical protein